MTTDHFIKGQLANFAHQQAAHMGGIDNMLAVLFVLRNRKEAGWQGGDWMRILQAAPEVAAALYLPSAPDLRDLNFKIVLQQVDDIYNGQAEDKMTEKALYFCELNNTQREWFIENIVRSPENHARVATVGNVSFFL